MSLVLQHSISNQQKTRAYPAVLFTFLTLSSSDKLELINSQIKQIRKQRVQTLLSASSLTNSDDLATLFRGATSGMAETPGIRSVAL